MKRIAVAALLLSMLALSPVHAVLPDEVMSDPAFRRARTIQQAGAVLHEPVVVTSGTSSSDQRNTIADRNFVARRFRETLEPELARVVTSIVRDGNMTIAKVVSS